MTGGRVSGGAPTGASIEVGVFGGSGFYELFDDDAEQVRVDTPYGAPSGPVAVGTIGGRPVGFMPRHGAEHQYPAHAVNYRANLWAMKHLGASDVVLPCAAGSLQPGIAPGDLVVCDQLVDRTRRRVDSYFDGPVATHVGFAEPYDAEMRATMVASARSLDLSVRDGGTVVVIEGPRFTTRAESAWFTAMGWDVVNMSAYPEAILARELEMAAVNISLVTDYDAGVVASGGVEGVSARQVVEVFQANVARLRMLLDVAVPALPLSAERPARRALERARL
jgi:5'-methylthioadenosine phosphorylase